MTGKGSSSRSSWHSSSGNSKNTLFHDDWVGFSYLGEENLFCVLAIEFFWTIFFFLQHRMMDDSRFTRRVSGCVPKRKSTKKVAHGITLGNAPFGLRTHFEDLVLFVSSRSDCCFLIKFSPLSTEASSKNLLLVLCHCPNGTS